MNRDRLSKSYKPGDLIKGDVKVSSPPTVFFLLNEALNNPSISVLDIANIISGDQGLTARLLRLANSPFHGFPSKIETISQAVLILGTQQIHDLTLATTVLSLFEKLPKELVNIESFWYHSISCGLAARVIAAYRREPNVERFFVAGTLHDIGRLIMYMKMPELSLDILVQSKKSGELLYKVERERMGFDHADVGGILLENWKLPLSIEEMVRFHHNPLRAMHFPIETAVIHVADIIAHAMQLGTSGERFVPPLDATAWERIEISPSIISSILKRVDQQFTETIRMLQVGEND
ncbi:MAG: HDOD domain-containing protein [Nitrospirota bacterium]